MACGLFSFCISQKSCDGDRRLIPSMSTCFYYQDLHLKKCSTNKKCKRHFQCPIRQITNLITTYTYVGQSWTIFHHGWCHNEAVCWFAKAHISFPMANEEVYHGISRRCGCVTSQSHCHFLMQDLNVKRLNFQGKFFFFCDSLFIPSNRKDLFIKFIQTRHAGEQADHYTPTKK